jgi:hypothetical protein
MRMVAVPGRVISLSDELDDGPSRKAASITIVLQSRLRISVYSGKLPFMNHTSLRTYTYNVFNYSPSYVK